MVESPLAWQFGCITLLISLFAARILCVVLAIGPVTGRNTAIDGLRGYLAIGVFLSHGVIWFYYARSHAWALPPDSIYRDMGGVCVRFFFMITGYLFFSKLLGAKEVPINWQMLFISRFLRLTPLYLVSMFIFFTMVGFVSNWQLHEPLDQLLIKAGNWLMFTLVEGQDLNGLKATSILIAAVTWSLAYEWMFYFSLPILAVFLRVKVPLFLIVACSALLALILANKAGIIFPTSFCIGAVAAYFARIKLITRLLRKPIFGLLILCTAILIMFGHLPSLVQAVMMATAFCAVACGNTAFGLLSNRAAVFLGDISYGIYLLHGLVLSAMFMLLFGLERVALWSPAQHWLSIVFASLIAIAISAFMYLLVEMPCMKQVKPIDLWIRMRIAGHSSKIA